MFCIIVTVPTRKHYYYGRANFNFESTNNPPSQWLSVPEGTTYCPTENNLSQTDLEAPGLLVWEDLF